MQNGYIDFGKMNGVDKPAYETIPMFGGLKEPLANRKNYSFQQYDEPYFGSSPPQPKTQANYDREIMIAA